MSPAVLSKSLMQQKEKESHFLEQLLDPHKIDDYQLPIPINAELRKYQQVRYIYLLDNWYCNIMPGIK